MPFVGALLCGVIYGAASGFGLPYMIDQVFPRIFPRSDEIAEVGLWTLVMYVAWFPAVFALRGVSGYFNVYLINYCGVKVLEKIRLNVFEKLQRLPLAFHHKNREGDLLSRVMADTTQLQTTVLQVGNDIIKQPVTFVGAMTALVVMALKDENLAFILLSLVVIPLCVFPVRRIGNMLMTRALRMQEEAGSMTAVLSENLSAAREVRAFNLEDRELTRFRESSEDFFTARMKVIKYAHLLTPLIEIITAVGVSAAIFQASRKGVHLDTVIPVIVALYMSYEPVKKLGGIHNQIKQAFASLDRLDDILDAPETIVSPPAPKEMKDVRGEITFEGVSYSYENGDGEPEDIPAIANLNLSLKAGETVALVGPSGAGKSTLAGLLPRFHDPSEGKVFLDGVDLREFSLKDLRDSVALVPQRPFLFDATVRENVLLGQTEQTDLEVEKVCELAYADEFVKEFRRGYEERLGEDGSRLSGGQLQRIALARAFLKNAPILILDEATSALDAENEDKIRDAMTKLIEGKTTLLIAHRFSSLKLAHRILVMDEGKIIADGSHDELHRECDLYRKLYDSQFGIIHEDAD
ncbi:MAG: ABC transporter ATP-binding protein [Opitutae bacterium]|nr:ABC transporter ATP-binding protein [Opitutae bacterium]MBT7925183.1 ABC transporter ATP-binding protein [Opitutae bacterium]